MKEKIVLQHFLKRLLLKLLPYLIALVLIRLTLPPAIRYAYLERGYHAYGGEWLIPVFFIVAAMFVDDSLTNQIKNKKEF